MMVLLLFFSLLLLLITNICFVFALPMFNDDDRASKTTFTFVYSRQIAAEAVVVVVFVLL